MPQHTAPVTGQISRGVSALSDWLNNIRMGSPAYLERMGRADIEESRQQAEAQQQRERLAAEAARQYGDYSELPETLRLLYKLPAMGRFRHATLQPMLQGMDTATKLEAETARRTGLERVVQTELTRPPEEMAIPPTPQQLLMRLFPYLSTGTAEKEAVERLAPTPKEKLGYTLSPGQTRFAPGGVPEVALEGKPEKPEKPESPGQALVAAIMEREQHREHRASLAPGSPEFLSSTRTIARLSDRIDDLKSTVVPEGGMLTGGGTRTPIVTGQPKPVPIETARAISTIGSMRQSGEALQAILNDPTARATISPYFGKYGQYWEAMQRWTPGGLLGRVPPEITAVDAHVKNILNYAIWLVTGAAVRETEEPRLKATVPDFGVQDVNEFEQRLTLFFKRISEYERMTRLLALRGDKKAALTAIEAGLLTEADLPKERKTLSDEERTALGIPRTKKEPGVTERPPTR